MIILNLGDGSSRKYDLRDPSQLAALNDIGQRPNSGVTGIWIKMGSQANTIPVPKGFRAFAFEVDLPLSEELEILAASIRFQMDDIELMVVCYPAGHSRITVQKIGKPRYLPRATG